MKGCACVFLFLFCFLIKKKAEKEQTALSDGREAACSISLAALAFLMLAQVYDLSKSARVQNLNYLHFESNLKKKKTVHQSIHNCLAVIK